MFIYIRIYMYIQEYTYIIAYLLKKVTRILIKWKSYNTKYKYIIF